MRQSMLEFSRCAPWLGLFALLGCPDDPQGPTLFDTEPSLTNLKAVLSASEVPAGTRVSVTCEATDHNGAVTELTAPDVQIQVSPEASVDGHTVVATAEGRYLVACKKSGFEKDEPAELVVLATEAIRVVTILDPDQAPAGTDVTVTCLVQDVHGNNLNAGWTPEVSVTPARGTTLRGLVIETRSTGTYEVACHGQGLEKAPAILTVIPGAPATLTAEPSSVSVLAGDRVEVTCHAADAFGNLVLVTPSVEVAPPPEMLDATGFSAITSGDYDVTCALESGLTSSPVLVRVHPNLPSSLVIAGVNPAKSLYAGGELVTLDVEVRDVYGNLLENPAVTLSGSPMGSVVPSGTGVVLAADGLIELIASADPPTQDDLPVTDRVSVQVDAAPPALVITFPGRAEMVEQDPTVPLTVEGTVQDSGSGVTSLTVNQTPISPDANGHFTAVLQPEWGINLIEATAVDGLGNVRDLAQSFEIASSYQRTGPTRAVSGRIADGVLAHLGQPALDDNQPDVDDLATIVGLALANLDVAALIPDPATTFRSDCSIPFVSIRGALNLHVDSVSYGTPEVSISSVPGGLALSVSIPQVAVDMRTTGDVCDIAIRVRGTASANRITASGTVQVAPDGTVQLPNPTVTISGLSINLHLPSIIDWAVDGIINLFRGAISNALQSAFQNVLRDRVPPAIEGFLGSAEIGTRFDLPAPLSTRLEVRSGLGMLRFDNVGGCIGFDTTIYGNGSSTPEPRGGILQESTTLPSFSPNHPLAVALAYDLVNQALYSAWYSGAFDIDLAPFFSGQLNNNGQMVNVRAQATALLPPVLGPSQDAAHPVALQVGDLQIDLELDNLANLPPIQATVYAFADVQADIAVDSSGQLQITLAPQPRFVLDVTSSLGAYVDLIALTTMLENLVANYAPQIFGQVIQGIPLPTFDLSSIPGSGLPSGTVLGIDQAQTRFTSSYVIFEGSLVQIP